MSNYVIYTDSACDIKGDLLENWGVKAINLTLSFESDGKELANNEIAARDFYERMRNGDVAKTSAVNMEAFKEAFELELKDGNDVLYIGFSSGLSTTYNSARIAAEELAADYPERKILTVDSLCASAGFGMLIRLATLKKEEGALIEEVADFVNEKVPHMCHWFTVDDLVYLKRGGRISPTVAFVGGLLGIKPVLHMDDEGHLVSVSKVRGRISAIKALADKFDELAIDNTTGPVYISHGDCIGDAEALAGMIESKHGVKTEIITDVGPVIGAHSGPGTLALFFLGKVR
ncbi:MAG: DegV family protein [Clostridia bacterium]|nr:DegV family protein [Clostridia bacterium]